MTHLQASEKSLFAFGTLAGLLTSSQLLPDTTSRKLASALIVDRTSRNPVRRHAKWRRSFTNNRADNIADITKRARTVT